MTGKLLELTAAGGVALILTAISILFTLATPLTLIFIVLKLLGVLMWHWALVLLPIILSATVTLCLMLTMLVLAIGEERATD